MKIFKGDIITATENIITHQVNCQGVMGSGLAWQIRSAFPNAYTGYKEFCNSYKKDDLLGMCNIVNVATDKYVANLFGQFKYGKENIRYTDYGSLRNALFQLKMYAVQHNLTVAIPYGIGCGLAKGDWNVVQAMINEIFTDYDVTIYVNEVGMT